MQTRKSNMYIISLDKKLIVIQAKFTKEEVEKILLNIKPEDFKQQVQYKLYQEFLQGAAKTIPTTVMSDENQQVFSVRGFILSERDMNGLIKELLEMDDVAKERMLEKVNNIIYGNVQTTDESLSTTNEESTKELA